jgi:hypothetical protein
MMPYDKNLDSELFTEIKEFDRTRIRVGVFSYNDGPQKVQLSRENKNRDDEWRFAKLGRLTKEEAEAILPMIQNAIGKIQED